MTLNLPRTAAIELRHSDEKPDDWPTYPLLPLIRPTGLEPPEDLELGLLIDGHGDLIVLANLVEVMSEVMMAGGVDQPEFLEWLGTVDTVVYSDFDAILDAGWFID